MNMDKRSLGLSAALIGLAGATLAVMRRNRKPDTGKNLTGKVALITGGSRGLGFAIARELARKGSRLVLTSRHLDGWSVRKLVW